MKILQTLFALFLICVIAGLALAQEKSKEKDKRNEQKPVELQIYWFWMQMTNMLTMLNWKI